MRTPSPAAAAASAAAAGASTAAAAALTPATAAIATAIWHAHQRRRPRAAHLSAHRRCSLSACRVIHDVAGEEDGKGKATVDHTHRVVVSELPRQSELPR
jgi:hypothetical protein